MVTEVPGSKGNGQKHWLRQYVWNCPPDRSPCHTGFQMRLARVFEKALRTYGRMDQWTDGPMDGRTDPLIEMRRSI